jgi:FAD/FMN-containing dehydrogenase
MEFDETMTTSDEPRDPVRRRVLQSAAVGLAVAACGRTPDDALSILDVAQLDATQVARVVRPPDTAAIQQALRDWRGAVSIGGGRFSMGGQIAAPGSLHLDLRALTGVVAFAPAERTIRVRAGMRWRDLLDVLDPHDLAVATMQSYSDFTVGGSVSVNCHGRYVGRGAIASTVRALQLVSSTGELLELARDRNAELFAATIGGYGGIGVISEVELELDRNTPIERQVERVALAEYPDFVRERVLGDADCVLCNADLTPPAFDRPLAIRWRRTRRAPTQPERLLPREQSHLVDRGLVWIASELPAADRLRRRQQEQMLAAPAPVQWRNREASLSVRSLEPATRMFSTYLLQEYFIPVAQFGAFARRMAQILLEADVNALNVSIRHAPVDTLSLLRWATQEVFCFVLYYKQDAGAHADLAAQRWTRALIDAALDAGGRYYLPYRLHATREQFRRAYPGVDAFVALKRGVDPQGRFRNRLWDTYLA